MFGERCSEFRDRRLAGLLDVPFELNPGRLEDADGGVADLWTDAVPRDQRYGMPTQSVEVGVSSRLPVFEIVGVDLDEVAPLLGHLILRKDGVDRARIDASAAVNALVGVDVIHVRRVV